ncbi:MAG: hypothetical protein NW200_12730 [Hyphomonadaceae bacterium]|nr:hypothetical protein [Hyphomonadaceae bacterium]
MRLSPFPATQAFTRAHKAAARAIRRGDRAGADQWLKIAERHERLALRLHQLCMAEAELRLLTETVVAERRRRRSEAGTPDDPA